MEIDLELYRIFLAVSEHLNITKAANALFISQPAVTQAIKKLESQLNVTLFVRTKRGVFLTEEGTTLHKYIKDAVEIIKNGENRLSEIKSLDTGTLSIGINTTLAKEFLMPYLEEFHKLYPKVVININKGTSTELVNSLRNGHIDLMLINLPFKNESDLKIIPCKKIHDVFAVNSELKYLADAPIPLSELNNHPLILQSKVSNTRKFLDDFAYKNDIIFKPFMESDSYTLVYEFTKIGMGIGYVTREFIKEDIEKEKLFEIKTIPSIPEREVGIVIKKDFSPRFITKRFMDLITKL